eukprot:917371-Prymnesium_polylepis.1
MPPPARAAKQSTNVVWNADACDPARTMSPPPPSVGVFEVSVDLHRTIMQNSIATLAPTPSRSIAPPAYLAWQSSNVTRTSVMPPPTP